MLWGGHILGFEVEQNAGFYVLNAGHREISNPGAFLKGIQKYFYHDSETQSSDADQLVPPEQCLQPPFMHRQPRVLEVQNAVFTDDIHFSATHFSLTIIFRNCSFARNVFLDASRFHTLEFRACRIEGLLDGRRAHFDGDFSVADSHIRGGVILHLAEINGTLTAERAVLCEIRSEPEVDTPFVFAPGLNEVHTDDGQYALNLIKARINGVVRLEDMRAYRPVSFAHGVFGRHLYMQRAEIHASPCGQSQVVSRLQTREVQTHTAVMAASLNINGDWTLEKATLHGQVRAEFLQCSSSIFLNGCQINPDERDWHATKYRSLLLDKAHVRGDIITIPHIADIQHEDAKILGLNVNGSIRIRYATINGSVRFQKLCVPLSGYADGLSIHLSTSDVGGVFLLKDSFLNGTLDAANTRFGRRVELRDSVVLCSDAAEEPDDKTADYAVLFNHCETRTDFVITQCEIYGGLSLEDALVAGDLRLRATTIRPRKDSTDNRRFAALNIPRTRILANMFVNGFEGEETAPVGSGPKTLLVGQVVMTDAEIGGSLEFGKVSVCAPAHIEEKAFDDPQFQEENECAINAQGVTVKRNLLFKTGFYSVGILNFLQARIEDDVRMFGCVCRHVADPRTRYGHLTFQFSRARIEGSVFIGISSRLLALEHVPKGFFSPDLDSENLPKEDFSAYVCGRLSFFATQIDGILSIAALWVDALTHLEKEEPWDEGRAGKPIRNQLSPYNHYAINLRLAHVGKDFYSGSRDIRHQKIIENDASGGQQAQASGDSGRDDGEHHALTRVWLAGGINAEDMRVNGSMTLADLEISRVAWWRWARSSAFFASAVQVENMLRLGPNFVSHGAVDLTRAQIGTFFEVVEGSEFRHGDLKAIVEQLQPLEHVYKMFGR